MEFVLTFPSVNAHSHFLKTLLPFPFMSKYRFQIPNLSPVPFPKKKQTECKFYCDLFTKYRISLRIFTLQDGVA